MASLSLMCQDGFIVAQAMGGVKNPALRMGR